ncbi:MAG: hypothetical protein JWM99_3284 [Verrucomicrobiales bacterium]|jgi:uncharacterized membrane protein YkoI|nr:hypothetical protein [Verrucomicrobiales bacterium]
MATRYPYPAIRPPLPWQLNRPMIDCHMTNQLLILIILGLASNLASQAQTAAGTAGGTSASASSGRAATGSAVTNPQAPAGPMLNQNTALQQQQQALRLQQIQQAQQQSLIGGLQQSGSAQNIQPQATLNQTTGAAAQPPQVGVATGLSASPTATTGQPPGVSPQSTTTGILPTGQLVNGTTSTLNNGAIANQVVLPDGTIATIPSKANPGTINNGLAGFGTNAAGALVPAVGTLATVPATTAAPAATVTDPNTVISVQPVASAPRPVLIQRTAKPTLVMNDLPDSVQQVLKGRLGDGPLYNLEKTTNNHGTVYRASFKNDNQYKQVEIADDGTVINDSLNTPAVIAAKVTPTPEQPIKASALPQAVLTALKAYGTSGDIQSIELVPLKDRSVYNIRLNREGTLSELQIAKDGTISKNTLIDPLAPVVTTPLPANEVADSAVTAEGRIEIPPAVRNTIQAQGGAIQVRDIQLDTVDGKPVYKVATQSNGKASTLQISPDGRIINGEGLAIAITDLPEKVQTAVKDEVGGAIVTGIQKESKNGQPVYNVRYNAKNGTDTHLLLSEDGRALPGRQSEALGRPAGPTVSSLQLSDLPTAARKTIMNQAGTASMDGVSVRTSQGQTIYSATFKKNGETQTVDVSQDGTLLKPE